jgi:hypothetical protein
MVAAAIASFRRYDKHNPQYYGELTVRNAAASLNAEHPAGRLGAQAPPPRSRG